MCRSLKAVLGRQDNRQGLISFIDISDPYYDPLAVSEAESGNESESGRRAQGQGQGQAGTQPGAACGNETLSPVSPVLWFPSL